MLLIQIETPYALVGLTLISGILAWIIKNVFWGPLQTAKEDISKLGKDMIAIQSAIKYYFETTAKGAAMVLDSDNPAPPEIRALLQKHAKGNLTENGERQQLMAWLRKTYKDEKAVKGERATALAMLAAVGALKRLEVQS